MPWKISILCDKGNTHTTAITTTLSTEICSIKYIKRNSIHRSKHYAKHFPIYYFVQIICDFPFFKNPIAFHSPHLSQVWSNLLVYAHYTPPMLRLYMTTQNPALFAQYVSPFNGVPYSMSSCLVNWLSSKFLMTLSYSLKRYNSGVILSTLYCVIIHSHMIFLNWGHMLPVP